MFALRSFLDAGIRATQASDYPPGPIEPMMALQSEVTRTDSNGNLWGPKQKITVDEALRVGTLNGAYASFEEQRKGTLAAGMLADIVVLSKDVIGDAKPLAAREVTVDYTIFDGKVVFARQ